jgi:hypothetical protein
MCEPLSISNMLIVVRFSRTIRRSPRSRSHVAAASHYFTYLLPTLQSLKYGMGLSHGIHTSAAGGRGHIQPDQQDHSNQPSLVRSVFHKTLFSLQAPPRPMNGLQQPTESTRIRWPPPFRLLLDRRSAQRQTRPPRKPVPAPKPLPLFPSYLISPTRTHPRA